MNTELSSGNGYGCVVGGQEGNKLRLTTHLFQTTILLSLRSENILQKVNQIIKYLLGSKIDL